MAQTPIENLPRTSDLVVQEWDTRHTREVADVSAYDDSASVNVPTSLLGWLVKVGDVRIVDGEEAAVTGIIIQDDLLKRPTDLDGIENKHADGFLQIVRGPAILKKEFINITDVAGDTIDIAAVVTRLKVLGITVLDPATKTSVKTP